MKTETEAIPKGHTIPIDRYIASDIHKHYVVLGGMNQEKEYVLRMRKVRMSRLPEWVIKNLKSTDAVVIEINIQRLGDLRFDRAPGGKGGGRQPLEGRTNRRCQGQDGPARRRKVADLADRRYRPRSLGTTPPCQRSARFDLASLAHP